MKGSTVLFVSLCIFATWKIAWPQHSKHLSVKYNVTDLGTLGGEASDAYAINNLGQVVGQSDTAIGYRVGVMETTTEKHAFLWTDGRMHDLGSLPQAQGNSLHGGTDSTAYSINDRGAVTGEAETGEVERENVGERYHAVVWQRGKMTDLGVVPGYLDSTASKINALGLIAGQGIELRQNRPTPRSCAVLFDGRRIQKMPCLCEGFTINDQNQRFGVIQHDGQTALILWQGRRVLTRVPFAASRYVLNSVLNDHGQAALTTARHDDVNNPALLVIPSHAATWKNGHLQPLSTLPAYPDASVQGINDSGQIVGSAVEAYGAKQTLPLSQRAVLWQDGTVKDLNDLIPQKSEWLLEAAEGINAKGQIVGFGIIAGREHAFLLDPVNHR